MPKWAKTITSVVIMLAFLYIVSVIMVLMFIGIVKIWEWAF